MLLETSAQHLTLIWLFFFISQFCRGNSAPGSHESNLLPLQTLNMSIEQAKRSAAVKAVDDYVKNGMIVGIGSGTTILYSVQRLSKLIKEHNWQLKFVPTSYQARHLIKEYDLTLTDLESHPKLDVCIDGADEVDNQLVLIKGGGGCLTQEKIVASASNKLIIVADYRKRSTVLGQNWRKGIPIEVIPIAHQVIKNKIEHQLGGKVILREAVRKMGPVVTDNGNFLLDWLFDTQIERNLEQWSEIERILLTIPGVVEVGLFVKMAEKAYFGMENGSVETRSL